VPGNPLDAGATCPAEDDDTEFDIFIFEKEKSFLIANSIKKVVYETVSNKNHLNFIQVMGFSQEFLNNTKCWTKSLV
jgi:hypothetical protein